MRPVRTLLAAVVVFIAAATPATAQDPARVDVSPGGVLQDGDVLTVDGSGFAPGDTVFLLLCNDDERLGDSIARCSLVGTGSTGYEIDPGGRFTASDVVVIVGQVGASEMATCPPSAAQAIRGVGCSIQVASGDLAEVAGVQVVYDGQPPAAPNELAFTGLRDLPIVPVAAMLALGGVVLLLASMVIGRRRRLEPDARWITTEARSVRNG